MPSNDVSVMEIAAKTLVKLALLPGSKGAESFDFDLKRAFEWLSEERIEVYVLFILKVMFILIVLFLIHLIGKATCSSVDFTRTGRSYANVLLSASIWIF